MKIIILRSSFQTDDFVRNEYADLIQRLENKCNAEINIIGDEFVETQVILRLYFFYAFTGRKAQQLPL